MKYFDELSRISGIFFRKKQAKVFNTLTGMAAFIGLLNCHIFSFHSNSFRILKKRRLIWKNGKKVQITIFLSIKKINLLFCFGENWFNMKLLLSLAVCDLALG